MRTILRVLLLAAALPLAADSPREPAPPAEFKGNAIMCKATYALCIKAKCEEQVSGNNQVRCTCDIIQDDWSLGPNSCMDRQNNLTSTYSNRYNVGSSILTCPGRIQWAWCYGASCEPDPSDPTKAICRCPVETSRAVILVSDKDCGGGGGAICSEMYSAARPAESKFANYYYWWWMTQKNEYQAEKPAEACAAQ